MSPESNRLVVQNPAGARVRDGEISGESDTVVEQVSVAEELQACESKCLEVKCGGSGVRIAGKTKEKQRVKQNEKGVCVGI